MADDDSANGALASRSPGAAEDAAIGADSARAGTGPSAPGTANALSVGSARRTRGDKGVAGAAAGAVVDVAAVGAGSLAARDAYDGGWAGGVALGRVVVLGAGAAVFVVVGAGAAAALGAGAAVTGAGVAASAAPDGTAVAGPAAAAALCATGGAMRAGRSPCGRGCVLDGCTVTCSLGDPERTSGSGMVPPAATTAATTGAIRSSAMGRTTSDCGVSSGRGAAEAPALLGGEALGGAVVCTGCSMDVWAWMGAAALVGSPAPVPDGWQAGRAATAAGGVATLSGPPGVTSASAGRSAPESAPEMHHSSVRNCTTRPRGSSTATLVVMVRCDGSSIDTSLGISGSTRW